MDAMQSCRHVLIFQRKLLAPSSRQMNKCWYRRQDRYKDRVVQGKPLTETKWNPSLSGVRRKQVMHLAEDEKRNTNESWGHAKIYS
jgi:hypothetical protein